jgi:hypothetical protein
MATCGRVHIARRVCVCVCCCVGQCSFRSPLPHLPDCLQPATIPSAFLSFCCHTCLLRPALPPSTPLHHLRTCLLEHSRHLAPPCPFPLLAWPRPCRPPARLTHPFHTSSPLLVHTTHPVQTSNKLLCRPFVLEEFGLTRRFAGEQERDIILTIVAQKLLASKARGAPFMGAMVWNAAPSGACGAGAGGGQPACCWLAGRVAGRAGKRAGGADGADAPRQEGLLGAAAAWRTQWCVCACLRAGAGVLQAKASSPAALGLAEHSAGRQRNERKAHSHTQQTDGRGINNPSRLPSPCSTLAPLSVTSPHMLWLGCRPGGH